MNNRGFFIGKALRFGWRELWRNWLVFLLYYFLSIGISFVFSMLSFGLSVVLERLNTPEFVVGIAYWVLSIASWVFAVIIGMGLIYITLKIYDGQEAEVTDLFKPYRRFWSYLATTLLFFLLVLVGLVVFIVPGIILSLTYRMAPIIAIDEKVGPIEALRRSAQITAGYKWDLIGLGFAQFVVSLIGFCAVFVGIFPAAIVVALSNAYVYRQLNKTKKTSSVKSSHLHK